MRDIDELIQKHWSVASGMLKDDIWMDEEEAVEYVVENVKKDVIHDLGVDGVRILGVGVRKAMLSMIHPYLDELTSYVLEKISSKR